jgi:hypothetical protein
MRDDAGSYLDLAWESLCRRLDDLDDVVFAALEGSQAALERARRLWPEFLREVGGRVAEESRDHYLQRTSEILSAHRGTRAASTEAAAHEHGETSEHACRCRFAAEVAALIAPEGNAAPR